MTRPTFHWSDVQPVVPFDPEVTKEVTKSGSANQLAISDDGDWVTFRVGFQPCPAIHPCLTPFIP